MTLFVAVSITEIADPGAATYTRVPAGFTATDKGAPPTDTLAVSELVAVSTTETVPSR